MASEKDEKEKKIEEVIKKLDRLSPIDEIIRDVAEQLELVLRQNGHYGFLDSLTEECLTKKTSK